MNDIPSPALRVLCQVLTIKRFMDPDPVKLHLSIATDIYAYISTYDFGLNAVLWEKEGLLPRLIGHVGLY